MLLTEWSQASPVTWGILTRLFISDNSETCSCSSSADLQPVRSAQRPPAQRGPGQRSVDRPLLQGPADHLGPGQGLLPPAGQQQSWRARRLPHGRGSAQGKPTICAACVPCWVNVQLLFFFFLPFFELQFIFYVGKKCMVHIWNKRNKHFVVKSEYPQCVFIKFYWLLTLFLTKGIKLDC